MVRKTSLILLGAAAGIAMTLAATQPRLHLDGARAEATASEVYRQLSLFGDVFERVRTDYVEKPDDGKLIESAINGMLAGLDPHSSYMDSKSLHEMQVEIRGEFGGVGIEVTMEEGSIKVVQSTKHRRRKPESWQMTSLPISMMSRCRGSRSIKSWRGCAGL